MKRILIAAVVALGAARSDAQSVPEQMVAAAAAATYVRTTLPAGRVAIVVDSEMDSDLNAFLADSLALPVASRADVSECWDVRKCRIRQGGSALVVREVTIVGDTAIVRVRTFVDHPSIELTESRVEDIRLQRRSPASSWVYVSKTLIMQT